MMEIIRGIPLLSNMPPDVVKQRIDAGGFYQKKYEKATTLYNQKDSCETLDIVLSGSFVTYSLAENGSAMQVFEFRAGQMLGANLLFGDNHAYPFSVYCEADGQILHIAKWAVADFLKYNDFAMAFIVMLSQNSHRLNQRVRMSLHKTLRENLMEYLENQSRLQQSDEIVLPISKKQLADVLGMQRPSLFRELKKLKDEGFIETYNRTVKLIK